MPHKNQLNHLNCFGFNLNKIKPYEIHFTNHNSFSVLMQFTFFAENSVVSDLVNKLNLDPIYIAHLKSAIQLGFISATLVLAIFTISGRLSPSLVLSLVPS